MAVNRREIDIAGKTLIIHDHNLSPDSAAGSDLGLGATVWDCAIILANYLPTYALARPLSSFSVLELGAGTGLPALAAASLGAPRVTLTDLPHLLPGLARNVRDNTAGDGAGAIPASSDVRVAALEWGRDEQADALELRPFDLVLMSDLLYDVAAAGDLCRTLRRVCGQRTEVLLAYELRAGTTECFRVLREQGFRWERVPSEELHPVWQSDDIGIFRVHIH